VLWLGDQGVLGTGNRRKTDETSKGHRRQMVHSTAEGFNVSAEGGLGELMSRGVRFGHLSAQEGEKW
jgi:hypothetical protein